MNNPEYAEIDGKKYKINTSYKVAIKCQEVATDESIGDYERTLAIIYLLYGDEGIDNPKHYSKLLEKAKTYLSCGENESNEQELENNTPDFDYNQDIKLIQASFKSDYGIDLNDTEMHWWDFFWYLNGLTENCVLNRVREIRTYDINQIKDAKERKKIEQAKKRWQLKTNHKINITQRQQNGVDTFYKLTGIKRKE